VENYLFTANEQTKYNFDGHVDDHYYDEYGWYYDFYYVGFKVCRKCQE
jgi:hypothetical protein